MKLELKTKSWENLFKCIRQSKFEIEGNFWAAIQHLETQFEEQSKKNLEVVNQSLTALNIEDLKKMTPGKIFAEGLIKDARIYNQEIRWLAKRGEGYHDWAVYYHTPEKSRTFIEQQGDKMFTEEVIRNLVPCTDEAWAMYRR